MSKRKLLSASILALMLTTWALAVPAQSPSAATRKPRIAVLDFDYGTVQTASSAMFGTNVDVGQGIVDLLVTGLVRDGSYSVIERKALDKILAEQNFSNSDRANPASAAKIGKLLGVDAIIEGSITEFGNETKKQNIGGGGGNWHGFGVGGFGHSNSKANVAVTARVINIDTGNSWPWPTVPANRAARAPRCWAAAETGTDGEAVTRTSVPATFSRRSSARPPKQPSIGPTANLVPQSSKVAVRTITVGVVAAVDGGQIILNVGGNAGIKVGDQFEVLRVTREIKESHDRQHPAAPDDNRRRGEGNGCGQCIGDLCTGLRLGLPGRRSSEDGHPVAASQNQSEAPATVSGGVFVYLQSMQ